MKKKNLITQAALIVICTILGIFILYPFLLVVAASFSDERDILATGYKLIPKHFTWAAYEYVFKNPATLLRAYKVTTVFSVAATVLSVFFMSLLAYPLTKTDLKGRNVINFYIYFTMLFGGGLVPEYILNTQYLHIGNTIWVYILPGLISPWYTFMIRTFFKDIPNEICESALIDGAGEYMIFFKMIIPLSKPVIAAVSLFTFLARWNSWYPSLLYIDNPKLYSLQYLLQIMLKNIESMLDVSNSNVAVDVNLANIPAETVRMAMAVLVAGPALVIFPFFQKYFVKGLTVGSVKG